MFRNRISIESSLALGKAIAVLKRFYQRPFMWQIWERLASNLRREA